MNIIKPLKHCLKLATAMMSACILISASLLVFNTLADELPLSFKGAQGFGQYTQGGKNGLVYIVNTLADDTKHPIKGSLRHALKLKKPRTVVFAVSGVIELKAPLIVKSGHLTIAGQSSPGGITVSGAPIQVSGTEQVIIRHMRFRLGTFTLAEDALSVRNSKDVIIDHCSFSWSVDEAASFYNNTRFTLQNSIIAFSLNHSIHPKGKHGYGGIWGGNNASFINNVMAHHNSRTPRINGHRLNPPYPQAYEFVEMINNVIFNWGSNNIYGSENGRFNLVNNYFKPGPASKVKQFIDLWYSPKLSNKQAYINGNHYVGMPSFTANNQLGVNYRKTKTGKRMPIESQSPLLSKAPLTPIGAKNHQISANSIEQSYQSLIINQDVGANHNANGKFIDSIDSLVLAQIAGSAEVNKRGLIDHEFELIGDWKSYQQQFTQFPAIIDNNQDGISDSWAAAHKDKASNIHSYLASLVN